MKLASLPGGPLLLGLISVMALERERPWDGNDSTTEADFMKTGQNLDKLPHDSNLVTTRQLSSYEKPYDFNRHFYVPIFGEDIEPFYSFYGRSFDAGFDPNEYINEHYMQKEPFMHLNKYQEPYDGQFYNRGSTNDDFCREPLGRDWEYAGHFNDYFYRTPFIDAYSRRESEYGRPFNHDEYFMESLRNDFYDMLNFDQEYDNRGPFELFIDDEEPFNMEYDTGTKWKYNNRGLASKTPLNSEYKLPLNNESTYKRPAYSYTFDSPESREFDNKDDFYNNHSFDWDSDFESYVDGEFNDDINTDHGREYELKRPFHGDSNYRQLLNNDTNFNNASFNGQY